jgi:hypothetical protein
VQLPVHTTENTVHSAKVYAFLAIQPIVAVAVTKVVDCPGAKCCLDFPSHFREIRRLEEQDPEL